MFSWFKKKETNPEFHRALQSLCVWAFAESSLMQDFLKSLEHLLLEINTTQGNHSVDLAEIVQKSDKLNSSVGNLQPSLIIIQREVDFLERRLPADVLQKIREKNTLLKNAIIDIMHSISLQGHGIVEDIQQLSVAVSLFQNGKASKNDVFQSVETIKKHLTMLNDWISIIKTEPKNLEKLYVDLAPSLLAWYDFPWNTYSQLSSLVVENYDLFMQLEYREIALFFRYLKWFHLVGFNITSRNDLERAIAAVRQILQLNVVLFRGDETSSKHRQENPLLEQIKTVSDLEHAVDSMVRVLARVNELRKRRGLYVSSDTLQDLIIQQPGITIDGIEPLAVKILQLIVKGNPPFHIEYFSLFIGILQQKKIMKSIWSVSSDDLVAQWKRPEIQRAIPLLNFEQVQFWELKDLIAVHMTGSVWLNKLVQNKVLYAGPLKPNVHFSLNHKVTAHMSGDWDGMDVAILIPFQDLVQKNATNFFGGLPVDAFCVGFALLPESTKILKKNSSESGNDFAARINTTIADDGFQVVRGGEHSWSDSNSVTHWFTELCNRYGWRVGHEAGYYSGKIGDTLRTYLDENLKSKTLDSSVYRAKFIEIMSAPGSPYSQDWARYGKFIGAWHSYWNTQSAKVQAVLSDFVDSKKK